MVAMLFSIATFHYEISDFLKIVDGLYDFYTEECHFKVKNHFMSIFNTK